MEKLASGNAFEDYTIICQRNGIHCSILEVDVVSLEIDIAKVWLQRSPRWASADERSVEVGCDKKNGRSRVILAYSNI
jgi:hypothetical protein